MSNQKEIDINLAASYGLYCGACLVYLLSTKGVVRERGYKRGCAGCRIQNKSCNWIKKQCVLLRRKEIDFCFKCKNFPCENYEKLNQMYSHKYNVSLVGNLLRIKEVGPKQWLKEQAAKWRCPKCGGNMCVHDGECFDCGYDENHSTH